MELTTQTMNPALLNQDIALTATVPIEMINAQQQLITWCDGKLSALKFESRELFEATEHAKKSKWKYSSLQSQYNRSLKKMQYYEKIKSALLEGYYIVPNFPISMFAIKTNRHKPEAGYTYSWHNAHEQNAQQLEIGKGEYKNPIPLQRQQKVKDGIEEKTEYFAYDWDDIEFPVTMAKPQIMQATTRAMSLKIFDRIGIMPAERKTDPVIIGQIFRKEGYIKKIVSFMIAWHLNTNML